MQGTVWPIFLKLVFLESSILEMGDAQAQISPIFLKNICFMIHHHIIGQYHLGSRGICPLQNWKNLANELSLKKSIKGKTTNKNPKHTSELLCKHYWVSCNARVHLV